MTEHINTFSLLQTVIKYSMKSGKEAGITIGIAEGTQQKAVEVASNLLAEGDSPEKVSRCIGLPLEKVLELQKKINNK